MPRIAATLLTVTIMAVAIGVNIYRYPVVTDMVSGTITRDQSESTAGREPLLTIPEASEALAADDLASEAWDETVGGSSAVDVSADAAEDVMAASDVVDSRVESAAIATPDAGVPGDRELPQASAVERSAVDRNADDDCHGQQRRGVEASAASATSATSERYGDIPDRRAVAITGASYDRTDELLTTRPLVPVVIPEPAASESCDEAEDQVRRLPSIEGSVPLVASDSDFRLPDGSIPFYPSTGGPE